MKKMAILRFDPNVALEFALKYDIGKRVHSRIPEAPDQVMYTVCDPKAAPAVRGDTVYLPLIAADQIEKLGIKKLERISICRHVHEGATRWEVKRLEQPAPAPTTVLEDQLERSIAIAQQQQQQARRESPSKATPADAAPGASAATQPTRTNEPLPLPQHQNHSTAIDTIHHTGLSQLLAGCMTAAIDAAVLARDYAHSKGLTISLTEQSVQDLATTLLIHVQRMAELECKYDIKAAAITNRVMQKGGSAEWRQ